MQDKHIDTRRYANRIRDAYTLTEAEQVLNWYATEVWNKALELLGDGKAPEQITDGIKTGRRLQESWNKGFNHARAELRSAIQQQIDKIGGKE